MKMLSVSIILAVCGCATTDNNTSPFFTAPAPERSGIFGVGDELGYDTYVGLQTEELQNIFNLPIDIHEYKGKLYYTTKELP